MSTTFSSRVTSRHNRKDKALITLLFDTRRSFVIYENLSINKCLSSILIIISTVNKLDLYLDKDAKSSILKCTKLFILSVQMYNPREIILLFLFVHCLIKKVS